MNVEGYRIHQWGGPLRWEAFDVPDPQAGEIRIRVEACGIGLTVLNCIRGDLANDAARLPRVPGHEIVGTVEAVGAGVTSSLSRPARHDLFLPGLRRLPRLPLRP